MKNLIFFISILLISSCAKEEFSTKKKQTITQAINRQTSVSTSCSASTLIKPPVDFLFLWDNSTSTAFINDQTKAALNNLINSVSSRFDTHALMAPLIGSGNNSAFFVSDDNVGLSSYVTSTLKVDKTHAASKLSQFPTGSGNAENGLARAVELLSINQSNGIFRKNAYTMVVIMSNEDDNSWVQGSFPVAAHRDAYILQKYNELMCIRGNFGGDCSANTSPVLDSLQMRFFSVVAHQDNCNGNSAFDLNFVYKRLSELAYTTGYTNSTPSPTDQLTSPYDSFNICDTNNFSSIFDGINSSIQSVVLSHKYDHWPVAGPGAAAITPDEITVVKNDGTAYPKLTPPVPNGASGFTFTNSVQTVNTRFEPTSGEPFTGYLVKLFGDAKVTFPECLTVKTVTPVEFFGYVQLSAKPFESSIVFKINGATVPKSITNGWQLVKSGAEPLFLPNQNIKVVSPTDLSPANPALNKSGYFLKLHGSAIYSNGDQLEIVFDPSS